MLPDSNLVHKNRKEIVKSHLRKALLIIISAATLACAKSSDSYEDVNVASNQEASCGFIFNSKGYRVSWEGVKPVTFYFAENFPQEHREEIRTAARRWNDGMSANMIAIANDTVPSTVSAADMVNTIYWITDTTTFRATEQAKTIARWRDTKFVDTDILINAQNWTYNHVPAPTDPEYKTFSGGKNNLDLESLIVHEFGHSLGLAHQSIFDSMMYPSLYTNTIRNIPLQKPDLEGLKCEYK